jgi:hypothetical protein
VTNEEIQAAIIEYRRSHSEISSLWSDHRPTGVLTYHSTDDPCDEWAQYDMTAETLERIMTAAPEWKPRPDRLYRFYKTTGDGKTASWTATDPYRK